MQNSEPGSSILRVEPFSRVKGELLSFFKPIFAGWRVLSSSQMKKLIHSPQIPFTKKDHLISFGLLCVFLKKNKNHKIERVQHRFESKEPSLQSLSADHMTLRGQVLKSQISMAE